LKNKTIEFYKKNTIDLISQYNLADMSELYSFILDNISVSGKMLDIGFGSGRDLKFFKSIVKIDFKRQ